MSNFPCGLETVNDFKEKTFEVFLIIDFRSMKRFFLDDRYQLFFFYTEHRTRENATKLRSEVFWFLGLLWKYKLTLVCEDALLRLDYDPPL